MKGVMSTGTSQFEVLVYVTCVTSPARARAHQCCRAMEYERALFRVYDKSMEGFNSPRVKSLCNLAQKLLLVTAAGLFAALFLLHRQFVNNPGEA